nr:unnamed protein product [Spirometra erinaceieuropaei]
MAVTAVSVTPFSEEGQPKEPERRNTGFAFVIRYAIVGRLLFVPQGIRDRMATLYLPVWGSKPTTVISAYPPPPLYPPITSSVEARNNLYEDLHVLLTSVLKSDKLPDFGDFSAHVGTGDAAWKEVTGLHGLDGCNENGLLLQRTYVQHGLLRHPTREQATWSHSPQRC